MKNPGDSSGSMDVAPTVYSTQMNLRLHSTYCADFNVNGVYQKRDVKLVVAFKQFYWCHAVFVVFWPRPSVVAGAIT